MLLPALARHGTRRAGEDVCGSRKATLRAGARPLLALAVREPLSRARSATALAPSVPVAFQPTWRARSSPGTRAAFRINLATDRPFSFSRCNAVRGLNCIIRESRAPGPAEVPPLVRFAAPAAAVRCTLSGGDGIVLVAVCAKGRFS